MEVLSCICVWWWISEYVRRWFWSVWWYLWDDWWVWCCYILNVFLMLRMLEIWDLGSWLEVNCCWVWGFESVSFYRAWRLRSFFSTLRWRLLCLICWCLGNLLYWLWYGLFVGFYVLFELNLWFLLLFLCVFVECLRVRRGIKCALDRRRRRYRIVFDGVF